MTSPNSGRMYYFSKHIVLEYLNMCVLKIKRYTRICIFLLILSLVFTYKTICLLFVLEMHFNYLGDVFYVKAE